MFLKRLLALAEQGRVFNAEGDEAGGGEQGGAVRTIAEGGADGGAGAAAAADSAAIAPAWGENWRDQLAGDNAEAKKLMERLATPADFVNKFVNQEKTIRSGAHKGPLSLPDGATEEEVAAYRKAVGVPDKPDGYGFAFPEEVNASEADNAALAAFSQFMHERHVPPQAAKAAFEFYLQSLTTGRAEQAERVQEMTLEQAAELRKELPGREFQRAFGDRSRGSVGYVGEFLSQHFEGDDNQRVLADVLNARLENGLRVGDYAPFLMGMARMAKSYSDDEALIGGDGAGGGQSIDDEYNALILESVTKPREFNANTAKVSRLNELATARVNRDERAARRDERGRFAAA